MRAKLAYPLDQANEHIPTPSIASDQPHLLRHAPALHSSLKTECFHSFINSLLRHRPIRRPLAARNRQKPRVRDVNHVVPHKTLCAAGRGVPHERPQPAPCAQHVPAAYFDIRREVAADLLENPADLLFCRTGLSFDCRRRIGRPRDGVTLPWEEENDAPVGGGGIEETHCAWGVVVRERNMYSGGCLDYRLVFRVVEGKKSI